MRARSCAGQPLALRPDLRQHLGVLRIVGHLRYRWPGKQQVRARVPAALDKQAQDASGILEAVPA